MAELLAFDSAGSVPAGAATSANQTTEIAKLTSIDGKLNDTTGGALKVDGSAFTQPVSGSVSVSNFPATQPISGSVSVSNFPATQPVSGTVTANAGTGSFTVAQATGTNLHTTVDNFPATQTVTGSVTVSNFPATQAVTQSTSPWVTRIPDVVTTGSITSTQSVTATIENMSNVAVDLSGTWTGSVTVEGSVDGTSFYGMNAAVLSSGLVAGTFSANNAFQANVSGLSKFRVRGNTVSSGTLNVTIRSSSSTGTVSLEDSLPNGGNTIGIVNQGTGGSSAWKVDGSAVTQPVSGSVTATISGTVPVSGPLTDDQLRASAVPVSGTFFQATQPVSAAALPLPSGASTSALQTTGNSSLSSIDGKTPALGQALAASSVPVVLPASQISTLTPLSSVTVTQATGTNLHTVIDSGSVSATVSGSVSVSNFPATQPVSGTVTSNAGTGTFTVGQATGTNLHTVIDSGTVSATVSGSVSVSNFPATQPVSGAVTANAGSGTFAVSGPLTDTQLRATPVPVSGTFFQATQPVSGTVTANAGSGTFAISAAALPLPSGAATDASITGLQYTQGSTTSGQKGALDFGAVTTAAPTYVSGQSNPLSLTTAGALRTDSSATTQPVSGTVAATQSGTWTVQPGNTANSTAWLTKSANDGSVAAGTAGTTSGLVGGVFNTTNPALTNGQQAALQLDASGKLEVLSQPKEASLVISTTGAAAAAVTATLPAVAGQFHYITGIEIVKYYAAAVTGTATPIVSTSTNLPGPLAFTFETAGAIGTQSRQIVNPTNPIKSTTVNTSSTIVLPATTSVIWRINVYYFTAP